MGHSWVDHGSNFWIRFLVDFDSLVSACFSVSVCFSMLLSCKSSFRTFWQQLEEMHRSEFLLRLWEIARTEFAAAQEAPRGETGLWEAADFNDVWWLWWIMILIDYIWWRNHLHPSWCFQKTSHPPGQDKGQDLSLAESLKPPSSRSGAVRNLEAWVKAGPTESKRWVWRCVKPVSSFFHPFPSPHIGILECCPSSSSFPPVLRKPMTDLGAAAPPMGERVPQGVVFEATWHRSARCMVWRDTDDHSRTAVVWQFWDVWKMAYTWVIYLILFVLLSHQDKCGYPLVIQHGHGASPYLRFEYKTSYKWIQMGHFHGYLQ